jgi:hypothetical protein
LEAIHDLAEKYGDRVAFFVVYIREAHPEDGWVLTMNRDESIAIADPTSDDQREEAATSCALRTKIRIPVVIDRLDDAVARAYGGWPDRLYLIGKGGTVSFQGEEGPVGFRPAELEHAIEAELALIDTC